MNKKLLAEIASHLDTDKSLSRGYLENFEKHFGPLRDSSIKILELGVYHGGSLLMWREYFPNALVVGLDRKPNPFKEPLDRIRFYRGSQDDTTLLDKIAEECAPKGFDIIIDDAAHIGTLARASFRHLFHRHIKAGGLYVIEDWGTGYWDSWPDGATYQPPHTLNKEVSIPKYSPIRRMLKQFSWTRRILMPSRNLDSNFVAHNFGMVGFVKELVDEVGWSDVTCHGRGNQTLPQRSSAIHQMTIYAGHIFLVKA